jgi:uncharacterized protein (DUF1330 family)
MSYYFLAGITIRDPEEYQRYLDRADDYQAILKHRLDASECNTILIKGNDF